MLWLCGTTVPKMLCDPRAVSSTCFLSRLMGIVVLERLPWALLVQMARGKVLNNLDFRMRSQGSRQVFFASLKKERKYKRRVDSFLGTPQQGFRVLVFELTHCQVILTSLPPRRVHLQKPWRELRILKLAYQYWRTGSAVWGKRWEYTLVAF